MKQILTPSRATEMIDNGKFGRELSLMLAKAGKFGLRERVLKRSEKGQWR